MPPVLYGLHQVRASHEKDDEQEILYTTAVPADQQALNMQSNQRVTLEAGDYVQFSNQTPAWYRRSSEWNSYGIRPPIRLDNQPVPEAQFVTLPETILVGQTQSYTCALEQISRYRDEMRVHSGYSKWHLQRMFKEVTGHAIGAYIRARRLSKAAVALRLTSRPILDIALQYRFDSQQTFTRAFKKQFLDIAQLINTQAPRVCAFSAIIRRLHRCATREL
ncbi:hypothetical protein CRX72_08025 [Pantoea sp. BRM17]|nr:hypothetical protein CRX72_08025 [Pantoea sp. BRM17]